MDTFISNQETVFKNINKHIEENCKAVIISGGSGSGKSYILNCLAKQFSGNSYQLLGDEYSKQRRFYPFTTLIASLYNNDRKRRNVYLAVDSAKDISEKIGSISPIGGELISSCIEGIVNRSQKGKELVQAVFSEEERNLLFQLTYFFNKERIVLLCDDVQYWDEESLQMLYTLMKSNISEPLFANLQFVISVTKDDHGFPNNLEPLCKISQQHLTLNRVPAAEYLDTLSRLGLSIKLNNELTTALFSITSGNLQLSKDIVNLINNDFVSVEETIKYIVNDKSLGHLMMQRIDRQGQTGHMVNETLKFASLFGASFQFYELEIALHQNEGTIREIVDLAESLSLVNGSYTGARFIHEIIRDMFKKETESNKLKYYSEFSKCLKTLYPGQYMNRAKSLLIAGEYKAAQDLLVLEALRQLRKGHAYPVELVETYHIPFQLAEYLHSMEQAYKAFYLEQYTECLNELTGIEDIFSNVFLAEKYYLYSITLSKWLESDCRVRAQECLEPYLKLSSINDEVELWERLLSAYIVACVHNNALSQAREQEHILHRSLRGRIYYDVDAMINLNILRRKAASIHSEREAYTALKKSKDFFAPRNESQSHVPLNPEQYYMSLNNYIAAALKMGKSAELIEDTKTLIGLPKQFPYISFPRFSMCINNAVIVYYLNKQISAEDAFQKLESVLDYFNPENAISTVVETNIAIFHALSGNFSIAQEKLKALDNQLSKIQNVEFYYYYLVRSNLIAVEAALGYEIDLKEIQDLEDSARTREKSNLALHGSCLCEAVTSGSLVGSPEYYKTAPIAEDNLPLQYYGRCFLFGELEFWSES